MPSFKAAGMTVIHKCKIVKHALKAQAIGCDAVIMDGTEAAGHVGENDIGSMVLWPAAVDALDIPVIACGGVGDGRGLAAALMLGCEGATVGTRFFLSEEAPALRAGKEMVAGLSDEMSTTLVLRRFTNTTRVLNNGLAVKVEELEHSGAPFEEIAPLASGRRLKKAFETGNLEDGVLRHLLQNRPAVKVGGGAAHGREPPSVLHSARLCSRLCGVEREGCISV